MVKYLKLNRSDRLILFLSPLMVVFCIPFYEYMNTSITSLLCNTLFLGSFHIIFTARIQKLIFKENDVTWSHSSSIFVLILGFFLSYLSLVKFKYIDENIFLVIILFAVVFHSVQQQYGILLMLGKVNGVRRIKLCFSVIPFIVVLDYMTLFYFGNELFIKYILAIVLVLCICYVFALLLYGKGKDNNMDKFALIFLLRLFLWPLGIFIDGLKPFVFALHGIEYFIFYRYINYKINIDVKNNWNFYLVLVSVPVLYLASFITPHLFESRVLHIALISAHFGMQFQHYWLDRQMFKLSKPGGQYFSMVLMDVSGKKSANGQN